MGTSILSEEILKWFHLSWKDNLLILSEGKAPKDIDDNDERNELLYKSIVSETIHWIGFAYCKLRVVLCVRCLFFGFNFPCYCYHFRKKKTNKQKLEVDHLRFTVKKCHVMYFHHGCMN